MENTGEHKKKYKSKYYEENREKILLQKKEYQKKNSSHLSKKDRLDYVKNREVILQERRDYYAKNRDKIIERISNYYKKNKDKVLSRAKDSYQNGRKDKIKEYQRNNRESINERDRKRKNSDPLYKMRCYVGVRTWKAFKNMCLSKPCGTKELLGADYLTVWNHIKNQLKPGMTLENYGSYWEIDHIIPLAVARTESELLELCHYNNLQPLEHDENVRKGIVTRHNKDRKYWESLK